MKMTFKQTKYSCYFAYITSAVINNITALLFVQFSKEFGLTLPQLSHIITMNFGIQIFVDFIGAKYADKVGYRFIVKLSQIFAALGLAGLGILPRILPSAYTGILIAAVIYAIGSGLTEVVISPIVEALPGDEKASAMSMLHSFYCWGHVLAVILSTGFFYFFGIENWSILCCLWAILPIITFVLFHVVPINQLKGDAEAGHSGIGKLFRVKIMWMFIILMLCSGAAEQSMAQWASFFAETELGISKQFADLLGPCLFAVAMGITRLIFGIFGDRLNMKVSLFFSGALCVASFLIAAFMPIPILSVAGCFLCGISVGIMWPGTLSLASNIYPGGGTAMFAILALAGDVGCFTGPETVARASAMVTGGVPSVKMGLAFAIIFPIIIVVICSFLLIKKKR